MVVSGSWYREIACSPLKIWRAQRSVSVTNSSMTIKWPIIHSNPSVDAGRRLRCVQVPWLGDEVLANQVELRQVSNKRCGGTRGLIYIERSVASYPAHSNLSILVFQKSTRSHHEVVSHPGTGLGTELLSCNSACLWCKSPPS